VADTDNLHKVGKYGKKSGILSTKSELSHRQYCHCIRPWYLFVIMDCIILEGGVWSIAVVSKETKANQIRALIW